jgi:signal transduction histidine kinase
MNDECLKKAKMLIVDNEESNVLLLEDILRQSGYVNFKGVTDSRQVVPYFIEFQPDLILLDLMMPHLDGFAVMNQLQPLIPADTYFPILVLTADTLTTTRQRALSGGAKDFLTKPVDVIETLVRIRNLLATRFLHLEIKAQNAALEETVNRRTSSLRESEERFRKLNRELERRVAERTAELEAANKELEAFSYSVSHDLRAPLRAIGGFATILQDQLGEKLTSDERHSMDNIQSNILRMSVMIDDMLALSQANRKPLQKQRVDIAGLVQSVLQDLYSETDGRDVRVTLNELPSCEADSGLIKQVWINLLSNAFKYTRKTERAVIDVGSRRDDGTLVYFVKDNGAGFDMKYANKLFGAFQRLHSATEFEGTGVGLANVRRIIARHGGRTWAAGEVGKGAAFYFSLPESRSSEDSESS